MTNVLVGQRAVAARQITRGEAAAFDLTAGQLLHIIDLAGGQVASMVAWSGQDHDETLSTAATMTASASLMLSAGSRLFSDANQPLFEVVEDSVGRHDLLTAPQPPEAKAPGTFTTTWEALRTAAEGAGIERPGLPAPVNFFKHVVVKQRGEIDVKDAFSERNDAVMLRVLAPMVVVIANAQKEKKPGISVAPGRNDAPGRLMIRVYQSTWPVNGSA